MDIKSRIKERGFTISQVAALMTVKDKDGNVKTGISQSGLSQLITGNPTYERLKEIADILGMTVSELVSDKEEFTAFVRNNGELKSFDTLDSLKLYMDEQGAGMWSSTANSSPAVGQWCVTKGDGEPKYRRYDLHLCVWDGENYYDNDMIIKPYAYMAVPPFPCNLLPNH